MCVCVWLARALISVFQLSSILWTVVIAFTLYMACLRNDTRFGASRVQSMESLYHGVCWVAGECRPRDIVSRAYR